MTKQRNGHRQSTSTNAKGVSRIPEFASREEEARFWDTHDVTDFLDETRPVTLRAGKNLTQGLTVRLTHEDREELERQATQLGVGPSTLARIWIKERLHQVAESTAP